MAGKLISLEGIDGSGKSTQVVLLQEFLTKNNIAFSYYKFPQYEKTFHGRVVSRFLKGEFGPIDSVSSHLITLAYAMDRATARPNIEQDLKDGKVVVCDRYVYSSAAFQGAKFSGEEQEKFVSFLEELEYKENNMPKEDLNILLDVPVNISVELMEKMGKKKDIHESAIDFLERVRELYLKLSKGDNWEVLNVVEGTQMRPREEIHSEILQILKKHQLI